MQIAPEESEEPSSPCGSFLSGSAAPEPLQAPDEIVLPACAPEKQAVTSHPELLQAPDEKAVSSAAPHRAATALKGGKGGTKEALQQRKFFAEQRSFLMEGIGMPPSSPTGGTTRGLNLPLHLKGLEAERQPRKAKQAAKRPPKPDEDKLDENDYEISEWGGTDAEDEISAKERRALKLKNLQNHKHWSLDLIEDQLRAQQRENTDVLFGEVHFVDLHFVFPETLYRECRRTRPRKARTSSTTWAQDGLKKEEISAYNQKLGL